jgi:ParB family chromosome partitioning protein
VLRRLVIQMRAERAKELVRAFKALPVELSADMDAHKVALATRMSFLRLDRGCRRPPTSCGAQSRPGAARRC